MSNSLKSQIVRLAYENPELRKHLLPLITAASDFRSKKADGELTPKKAYDFALHKYSQSRDKSGIDRFREIACKDPKYAYMFAVFVDKYAHSETRNGASKSPQYAYLYAHNVDRGPNILTWNAARKSPKWKAMYEKDVSVDSLY